MKVLDLFCGAGGAAMGLHRAWPTAEIVGVDINPQPRYPFQFVQSDAMEYPLGGFDFIWASPPCQNYSWATRKQRNNGKQYPHLLPAVGASLRVSKTPYCIENVVGAGDYLEHPFTLCGSMFGLGVVRHRLFEANFFLLLPSHRDCRLKDVDAVSVTGNGPPGRWYRKATVAGHGGDGPKFDFATWKEAMGIDWMKKEELTQAVPPAYSEYIARQAATIHP